MRYVILGGGVAGITAAKTIREYDSDGEITVYTHEFHPLGLYARKDLARRLRTGIGEPETFLMDSGDTLAEQGITLIYDEVLRVFPRIRQVLQPRHARRQYDRLLLAVGATPQLVNAPGLHYVGVHQLRSYEDAALIESWLPQLRVTGAVIIGGGVLGMDAAHALVSRGVPTTLVVREDRLGTPYLSPDEAQFAHERLLMEGVEIIYGQTVAAYLSEDERMLDGICLNNGRILPARMALCAVGVRPSTRFLEDSGIDLDNQTGAIPVNAYLQTNVSDIYAAGNCAVYAGAISRNWPTAAEQGMTAGLNMVGHSIRYQAVASAEERVKPLIFEESAISALAR